MLEPYQKKIVDCKWVFIIKLKSDGSIEGYYIRFIAKRFTRAYEIDYIGTFTPSSKLNSIRVILTIIVNLDCPFYNLI